MSLRVSLLFRRLFVVRVRIRVTSLSIPGPILVRMPLMISLCLSVVGCSPTQTMTPPSQAARGSQQIATGSIRSDQSLVVVVSADWCPTCHRIAPAVASLEQEYSGRVSFLVLDVTDDDAAARSATAADAAGVGAFFRQTRATGVVAVFDRERTWVATLRGEEDPARYRESLTIAMARQ